MTERKPWPCAAYGEEGLGVGALCFVAELGQRTCQSWTECQATVGAEQQRVFRAIQERAAAGDQVAAFLAGEFTSPSQLLSQDVGGEDPCTCTETTNADGQRVRLLSPYCPVHG